MIRDLKESLEKIKDNKELIFNFFTTLSIQNSEAVHSNFLAFLLNPYEKHDQKDLFLRSFCELFLKKDNPFESYDVWVNTEHKLSNEDDSFDIGSRVDIWIKDKNHNKYLLIENKLFAGDQKEQLLRYFRYLSESNSDGRRSGILIYLTLNGKPATKFSTNGKKEKLEAKDYVTLSYSKIIKWLKGIPKVSFSTPLDFCICQYCDVLDQLILKYEFVEKIIKADLEIVKLKGDLSNKELKYFKENKVLESVNSELEMQFWRLIEDKIRKKYPNVNKLDKRMYSYEKIIKRNEKLKQDKLYGLIFEFAKVHVRLDVRGKRGNLDIFTGYFDNEGNWKTDGRYCNESFESLCFNSKSDMRKKYKNVIDLLDKLYKDF